MAIHLRTDRAENTLEWDNIAMGDCKRVIFDTSGLNALAKDREANAVIAGLRSGYVTRFNEINIGEIVATNDAKRRAFLLRLCRVILRVAECMAPNFWIIEEMVRRYRRDGSAFDWRQVNVRWPELENAIAAGTLTRDSDLTRESAQHNLNINDKFRDVHREIRTGFESAFLAERPADVIAAVKSLQEGPLWKYASDFCVIATGKELEEGEARTLIDKCPPLRAFLIGLCVAQYNWSVRPERDPALFKAGALDYFMSVYLPYCDLFVTADTGQYNAFRVVAEESGLATGVCTYQQFRSQWTGRDRA